MTTTMMVTMDTPTDNLNDPQPTRRIAVRSARQKEVADITRDMLKGNDVSLPEIQASLHRTIRRYSQARFIEREVVDQILESNLLMSKALALLATELQEVKDQWPSCESLPIRVKAGEWNVVPCDVHSFAIVG
jgi:hypothetical protein